MSKAIIGIVVGSVLNSFFNRIISGITKEFERYNYHIIVLYCKGDPLKMHKNLELLQSISANAIIFEPMESYRLEIVEELRKNGTVMLQLFSQVYKELGGKLRMVITGAAALSPNIYRGFEDLGITVLQGYGMTECTPLISGTPQSAKERYRKAGSVGVPVRAGEVRIVGRDENGIGEILFRGPNVMLGYYDMPEETAKALATDGWLSTGDLGFEDKDGWIYLTGRKKNVIVTMSGENVYREELEAYVNDSPYVSDSMVFTSMRNNEETVGVQILPDMEFIQEVTGQIPDEDELYRMMKKVIGEINENLASYKRIRDVFVRKEDFTRTTTKKIRRQDNLEIR